MYNHSKELNVRYLEIYLILKFKKTVVFFLQVLFWFAYGETNKFISANHKADGKLQKIISATDPNSYAKMELKPGKYISNQISKNNKEEVKLRIGEKFVIYESKHIQIIDVVKAYRNKTYVILFYIIFFPICLLQTIAVGKLCNLLFTTALQEDTIFLPKKEKIINSKKNKAQILQRITNSSYCICLKYLEK